MIGHGHNMKECSKSLLMCLSDLCQWYSGKCGILTVCPGIHSFSTFTQYFAWGRWFRCIMGVKWVGRGAHYVPLPQEKSEVTVLSWHLVISGHMFNALDRTAGHVFSSTVNLVLSEISVCALFCYFANY